MNNVQLITRLSCFLISACMLTAWGQTDPTDELIAMNAMEGRLNTSLVDRVFNQWVGEEKSIASALEVFHKIATDQDRVVSERVKAHLTKAHLYWRYGDHVSALNSVGAGLFLGETTDGTLLKAQLLDAGGKESEAADWYRKSLITTDRSDEQEFLQIRLTMIQVDRRNVEALVALAGNRDQQFKDRAAIVLALLGYPEKALDLYLPNKESDHYVRQLIRVAEWALKAEDYERARTHAWKAFDTTEIRIDALYALTLVDEAYRSDGTLDELVLELESRGTENDDLLDLRIDLLMDLNRYADAIVLYNALNQDESDVEARQRLIQIYDTAGRSSEMVAEYEKLIAKEPNIVQWYQGLASHYINVAEPDQALKVWDRFEASNKDRIEVLVQGGEIMRRMGYVIEAVSMIRRYENVHGPSTIGNVFLFETHLAQGRDEEAEKALDELKASLLPSSSDLRVVADSYERLQNYGKALEVYLSIENLAGALDYDDQIRIARLWSKIGNQEQALNQWRDIWIAEEASARRNFAEGQLLQLAAEENALAGIAIEIESNLHTGKAKDYEMDLLVRIYMEVGDSFSATEVVNEFARHAEMTEVDRLRRLAPVYLQMQDHKKYDEVLRRLERIDQENRIEHIQNIVLNLLMFDLAQNTNERYDDIQYWINELRSYNSEVVSGEFEANVLATGGYSDEAIESYRRALIDQPRHSDNLLLMADLMKQNNRTDEAVALLQYLAEHATDDNEFVVAIDGIINMVGQQSVVQRLPPEIKAVFRWVHRVILERISTREDKFYLYSLLSEIAQETNDLEGGFLALENSVSQAGIRRLAVLREILTMATPNAGISKVRDIDRQLIYGRRLIGLRQQLPPDVFINIARTLLSHGNTLGAKKSLAMVRDITGLIDVTKTKGDLFLAEAYSKQALAAYSRALAVNRDSSELRSKTAAMREVNSQLDVANALYASALAKLMRTLPTELQDHQLQSSRGNSYLTQDYTTYYEFLMQGLIATWPEEHASMDVFLEMFDEEFTRVVQLLELQAKTADTDSDKVIPLSRFSRLDHIARLLRRLCVAVNQVNILDQIDLTLAVHFGNDESYADTLRLHFWDNGIQPSPELVERVRDLKFNEIPVDKSMVEFAYDSAVDQENIERITRLSTIVDPAESPFSVFLEYLEKGDYRATLRYASVALNEREYSGLLNTAVSLLQDSPSELMKLLIDDPAFLIEIEDQIGFRLSNFEDNFWNNTDVQSSLSTYFFSVPSLQYYFTQTNDVENLVSLFERIVEDLRPNGISMLTVDLFGLHQRILSVPLDKKLQLRVEDATSRLFGKVNLQDGQTRRFCDPMIFNFAVRPTNLALFFRIVEDFQERAGRSESEVSLLRDYYEGDKEQAYQTLLDMSHNNPAFGMYSRSLIYKPFKEQYLNSIQEIHDGTISDVEYGIAILNKSRYFEVNAIDSSEHLDLREKLAERFPENEYLLVRLISEYIDSDNLEKLVMYLRAFYMVDKNEEFTRMSYFLTSVENGNFDQALAVALDGGPSLLDKEVRDGIFARNDAVRMHGEYSPSLFLKYIRNRNLSGTHYIVDDILPDELRSMMMRLQEAVSSDEIENEEAPLLLRMFWRGSQAIMLGATPNPSYRVDNIQPVLLRWPSEGHLSRELTYGFFGARGRAPMNRQPNADTEREQIPTLVEVLITKAPVGRELEQFLVAMSPNQRRWSFSFMYDLVSKAYQQYPENLSERLTELSENVVANAADDHQFTLWVKLVLDSGKQLSKTESDAFEDRVRNVVSPTNDQLYMFSRLLIQLGRLELAVDCIEMLLVGEVEYAEFQVRASNVFMRSFSSTRPGVLQLIEDMSEHLPRESVQDMIGRIVPLVRPFRNLPEFQHIWEAFALRAFSIAYEPWEIIEKIRVLVPDIIDSVDVVRGFDEIRLVHLARIYNLAEDFERSNLHVRSMFTKKSIEVSSAMSKPGAISSLFSSSVSGEMLVAVQNLAINLGLNLPSMSAANGVDDKRRTSASLFISSLEEVLDFNRPDGVASLVQALQSWLDDSDIDRSSVFEALTSIAYIHVERKEFDQALNIMASLQDWLLDQPRNKLDERLLGSFISLVPHVSLTIEPSIAGIVCEMELLDKAHTLELLESLRQTHEAKELVGVAKLAYSDATDLPLLQEIREIIATAADEDFLRDIDAKIRSFEDAYETLRVAGVSLESSTL